MCEQCRADNLPMDAEDALTRAENIIKGMSNDLEIAPADVDWTNATDDERAIATLYLLYAEQIDGRMEDRLRSALRNLVGAMPQPPSPN